MTKDMRGELSVTKTPEIGWRGALEFLFANESIDRQSTEIARVLKGFREGSACSQGLFEARRNGQLVGVVRGEMLPGNVGFVWGPRLIHDEPSATAEELLDALESFFRDRNANLIQVLKPVNDEFDSNCLIDAGFTRESDLLYLVSSRDTFPSELQNFSGQFVEYTDSDCDQLCEVLEATYQNTLDYPVLNFRRPTMEVISGYQATGIFDARNWQFVRDHGENVGCVLVNQHAAAGLCELIYMGLVPRARGRGLGHGMVRQAQWVAKRASAEQLVLGVDSNNLPATSLYVRAGFVEFERRRVFLKFL